MKDQKDSDILFEKIADGVQLEQAHSEMNDPSNEMQWYLARDGKRYGPVSEDDLRRMYAVGKIKPTDHLWRQGLTDWREASDVSELFASGSDGDDQARPRLVRRARPEQEAASAGSSDNILRAEPLVDRPELNAGRRRDRALNPEFPGVGAAGDVSDPRFLVVPQYQPKRSVVRTLIYVVAAILILAIGGLIALPMFLPADLVRDQIVALVKAETGRDLVVRGKTKISAVPNLWLELRDVTLANPTGVAGDPLIRLAALNVDLKIWPLLSGRVEFAQFILKDPLIALRIDRDGRKNWVFKTNKSDAPGLGRSDKTAGVEHAPGIGRTSPNDIVHSVGFLGSAQAAAPDSAGIGSYFLPRDIHLGDVRVINGTLTFNDERNGVEHKVNAINLSVSLEKLSEPMKAEGEFTWRAEEVLLKADINSPLALMGDQSSPVNLNVSARHGSADFIGNISLADGLNLSGNGKANVTSLRSLAAWFGIHVPPGAGFGPMSYRSALSVDSQNVALKKVVFTIDGMKAEGDIHVDISKDRPYIKADLTLDRLDLNPYLGGESSVDLNKNSLRETEQRSLTQLIEKINTSEGKAEKIGSDSPESAASSSPNRVVTASLGGGDDDFSKAADADVTLSVSGIFYEAIKVGKSRLVAKLSGGNLTADLKEAELYGGTATGQIVLNSGKPLQKFSSVFELKNVSALPFLKDAATFDWVSGKGAFVFDLVGAGATKKEILASLQGKGKFTFTDGALEGINIPRMVRAFQKGQLSNWSREEKLKTDFSIFSANFTVEKGLAKTKDINFKGPLLRIDGRGTVNLPKEKIDLRLQPKLVVNFDGQAGQQDNAGFNFPLRIKGSWHKPKISPDIEGIANNPEAIGEAVAQAKKTLDDLKKGKFKPKNFEDLIKGILNKDDREAGGGPRVQ